LRWWELSLEVDREAVEAVAEVFHRFGEGGVAIEEPIESSFEDLSYHLDATLPVVVKTYLPEQNLSGRRLRQIREALGYLSLIWPLPKLRLRRLAEEDWASAWKAHFHPHRIGQRLVIRPSWEAYTPQKGELVIILDPGLAFGTGLHPTTRMCLCALEERLHPGQNVLDLGTGSGILALAAARLGASSVLALDIDEAAVAVARENVAINGLGETVQVRHGSLNEITPALTRAFDLLVANISASVIVELAHLLIGALKPKGVLIAGGIIAERLERVNQALAEAGAQVAQVIAEQDWRTSVALGPFR